MKKILQAILHALSIGILKRYRPDIIGITGSVGKTSTKEAIFTVLSGRFPVRRNIKNYNNEVGVPLTIIGAESGGRNPLKWLAIFWQAAALVFKKDPSYPKILVLEMGADRPGDIAYLVRLAPANIGIVTAIGSHGPVHVEFFGNIKRLIQEKREIVAHLSKENWAILNKDDADVDAMKEKTRARVLTFGFSEKADMRADHVMISERLRFENHYPISGISFKLSYEGNVVPIFLPSVLGKHQVYAALAAACVGVIEGMNLVEIAERLKTFQSPPGRMKLLPGIKNTVIVDDSYNSSPQACLSALDVLSVLTFSTQGRRFAILGDMSELGSYTEEGHGVVGKKAVGCVDILVTVGEKGKMIAAAARKGGMVEDRVFSFGSSEEVGRFLQERIREGDILLVKGSQVVRMEKIVKELMAEPERVKELLVRQDESWMKN